MTSNSRILLTMLLAVTVVACSPTVTITVPNGVTGRIVFAADKEGSDDIYTSDLDGQNLKRLTNSPKKESQPKWSPDGKKIVFVSDLEDLYSMNADGSNQIRLNIAPYKSASFPEWSPDGKKIVFSSDDFKIVIFDLQTGTLFELSSLGVFPSWSPDGEKLVFIGGSGTPPTTYFSTINADGTNQTGVLSLRDNGLELAGAPSWAPDGKTIAFGNTVSEYNAPDLGPFRDIAVNTGIQPKLNEMFTKVTILTYTMIMQPDGSGVTQITDQCAGSAWSPDSKWIICTIKFNGSEPAFDMYLVNVSNGNSFRLTDTPYNEYDPDWAP